MDAKFDPGKYNKLSLRNIILKHLDEVTLEEEIVYNLTPLFHTRDRKCHQEDLHYKKMQQQILLTVMTVDTKDKRCLY